jgi:SAM-dependent methyltransferase
MLGAWRRAGLRLGWRVIDVGAGPGCATTDLAELVGPDGAVLAIEQSPRFTGMIRDEIRSRGYAQVTVMEADLMQQLPAGGYDMAWCRWVASFVRSVPRLVDWIGDSLRPGGVAVFHEYVDYASWRFAPPRPHLSAFVAEVMESWRAVGGEPDVAPHLIAALDAAGFRLRSVRPLAFACRPGDLTWQWPAAFLATYTDKLQRLGRVSAEWVDAVRAELRAAEQDPASVMVTPLMLEVIAERPMKC